MQGVITTRGPITVLIRDVLAGNAQSVSGAIEAAAKAFAADPGGFSQMEVVLCAWDEDLDAVMQIEDDTWVLLTDPSERLELDAFSKLDTFDAVRVGSPVCQEQIQGCHWISMENGNRIPALRLEARWRRRKLSAV
jgi:hypothetical protein